MRYLLPKPNKLKPKAHPGFTLIELLMAVTLVVIIGAVGIGGMSHLLDRWDADAINARVENILDSFEERIETHQATDYEITFRQWAAGYTGQTNTYKKGSLMNLSFDLPSGSGTLRSTTTSTGTWVIETWRQGRFEKNTLTNASGSIVPIVFSGGTGIHTLDIYGNIDGVPTNALHIGYFDDDGVLTDSAKQTTIETISASGSTYSSLTIRNTLGRRELLGNGTTPLDTASITFVRNGKEVVVEVRK